MTTKTVVTATLDQAALAAASCGVCQNLLASMEAYQIDLGTDGYVEFLLFTPRLTADQLATLRPHRDCLLRTVITATTPQLFLIERQRLDGSWYQFDLRILSYARSPEAWHDLIARCEATGDRAVRVTWLAEGIAKARWPE